jgi:hypothetical protein
VKSMTAQWDAWAARCGVQPWPMPETPPNEASGKLAVPPYLQQYQSNK